MKTGLYLGNVPIGKVAVAQVVSTSDEINLQNKTVTPKETNQKITADYNQGYVGLGEVTVDSIPANYIKTNVDDPAGSTNIENGKQAYANGILVNGSLNVLKSITLQSSPSINNNTFSLSATNATKAILDNNATITYSKNAEELLGNATPQDVRNNVFFTSSKGLRIRGEYVEPTAPDTILTEITINPTTKRQEFYPENGVNGFNKITVTAIPSNYIDISANPNYKDTTIDSSTAATSSNIEQGKSAYVNGERINGELSVANSQVTLSDSVILDITSPYFTASATLKGKKIYNDGTKISIKTSGSSFGNAIESDVANGKTFTSAAGYKLTGTRVDSSTSSPTINLQENKNVTPTKSQQIIEPSSGYDGLKKVTVDPIPNNYVDTSDGDAIASNIELNKKAYVNGSVVTGNLQTPTSVNITSGSISGTKGSKTIQITGEPTSKAIYDNNTSITIQGSLPNGCGNATEADVKEGVTFTSANGYCLTGTYTPSTTGGGSYEYSMKPASSTSTTIGKANTTGSITIEYSNNFLITENGITLNDKSSVTGSLSQGIFDNTSYLKNKLVLYNSNLIFIPSTTTFSRGGTSTGRTLLATNCIIVAKV